MFASTALAAKIATAAILTSGAVVATAAVAAPTASTVPTESTVQAAAQVVPPDPTIQYVDYFDPRYASIYNGPCPSALTLCILDTEPPLDGMYYSPHAPTTEPRYAAQRVAAKFVAGGNVYSGSIAGYETCKAANGAAACDFQGELQYSFNTYPATAAGKVECRTAIDAPQKLDANGNRFVPPQFIEPYATIVGKWTYTCAYLYPLGYSGS